MTARLVLSSLRARGSRVVLALLAVALGVGVSTALAALSLQVGDDLARTLRAAGPNFVIVPAGARWRPDPALARPTVAAAPIAVAAIDELKRSFWRNNVLEAAPELDIDATLAGAPVVIAGTWFEQDVATAEGTWRTGLARLRPHWTPDGRFPAAGARELLLARHLAERTGLEPGAAVAVTVGGSTAEWRVAGVVEAARGEGEAWAPIEPLRAQAGRGSDADRIWISALVHEPPRRPPPDPARDPVGYERYLCTAYPDNVARELAGRIAHAEVLPMSEVLAGEARVVGRLNRLMALLALAAVVASVLGMVSTTTAAVVERSAEIGLLRALGATPRDLAALLLFETLVVAAAGGVLGWAVGVGAAVAIRGETFGSAGAANPLLLPLALAIAVAIAVLGTLGPLRMASRIEPARVLHV